MKTIILGAGFTGLAAGYGTDIPIYEATEHAGGICRSYKKYGFDFSTGGGHWIFENEKTQKAMEFIRGLVELNSYDRKAGIYYNKIFPYPIQTFTQKESVSTPGYFKDWLSKKFSQAECNMFFYPFNERYTAGLYDSIVQFDSYKTPPAGGVGFVSRFHDPVNGLTELVNKMAEKCMINYKKRAIKVALDEKMVVFADGEVVKYDKLISTIPLDQLLKRCGQNKYELPYSSVLVINIGAERGVNYPDEHWLYVPFSQSGFYRLGFYTNVNKKKAPEGMVSVSAEIAIRNLEYADLPIDSMCAEVVSELQSWRFIDEVRVVDPTWVRCAYTWNRTPEEREVYLQSLATQGVISTGRYGKWKFQGMSESIMDGFNAC